MTILLTIYLHVDKDLKLHASICYGLSTICKALIDMLTAPQRAALLIVGHQQFPLVILY